MKAFVLVLVLLRATLAPTVAAAGEWDLRGDIAIETRFFPLSPLFPEQTSAVVQPSLRLQPELLYEWNEALDRITFAPFLRLDLHDDRRTHWDIREFNWFHQGDDWSLLLGIGKVFWGVTESRHLVDIINQTDLVEDPDEEEKLGQPMVNLTLERDWGVLDLFFMPFFRERTFPANDARLRGPFPLVGVPSSFKLYGDPSYESDLEWYHPDWAVRWSHTIGEFDIGVAHFRGTSREPALLPEPQANGALAVRPRYDIIDQTSLDFQRTHEAWLWKLEAIGRRGQGNYFGAAVVGFEYTLFQVLESPADLGLLMEYLYDGRDDNPTVAPPTRFENDLFTGFRLALNNVADTQVLAGPMVDLETAEVFTFAEASHRIGQRWLVEFEMRWPLNADLESFTAGFRRDSFIALRVSRFF